MTGISGEGETLGTTEVVKDGDTVIVGVGVSVCADAGGWKNKNSYNGSLHGDWCNVGVAKRRPCSQSVAGGVVVSRGKFIVSFPALSALASFLLQFHQNIRT